MKNLPVELPGWYRALLSRYEKQIAKSDTLFTKIARKSMKTFVPMICAIKGIKFPERAIGGDWWIYRYRLDFAMGWLERESTFWVQQLVKPGMTVVDIGAHIGYYTRLFADLVGERGIVLAFEPSPENYPQLQHNTRRNSKTVRTYPYAVSDKNAELILHISPGHSNHSLLAGYTPEQGTAKVKSVILDDFLEELNIDEVNFIKIDVEGAEPLVIEGMSRLLRRANHLNMLIEYNPAALRCGMDDPRQRISMIEQFGYTVNAILPDGSLGDIPEGDQTVNILCRKI